MPYVTISTVRGILDVAQKKTLLERVTDLMVEVEGQGNPEFRRNVWVRIEEQEPALVARRHAADQRDHREHVRTDRDGRFADREVKRIARVTACRRSKGEASQQPQSSVTTEGAPRGALSTCRRLCQTAGLYSLLDDELVHP